MLEQGTMDLDTPDFTLSLVRSSQTVAALKPKNAGGFDFTPATCWWNVPRTDTSISAILTFACAAEPRETGKIIRPPARAHRSQRFPPQRMFLPPPISRPRCLPDIPLQITRTWALEQGKLVLRFSLKNKSSESVQIGALAIPMIFNNVLNDRTLEQAHAVCSFYDPYIGEDAGYLQVTRLTRPRAGTARWCPTARLRLRPTTQSWTSPIVSAQQPVFTDPTPRSMTFEGFYEWMVHSQAYAENEWKDVQQWNPAHHPDPRSRRIKDYGVKFLLVRFHSRHRANPCRERPPVAVGIPGYVLPTDMDGKLFLKYRQEREVDRSRA